MLIANMRLYDIIAKSRLPELRKILDELAFEIVKLKNQ